MTSPPAERRYNSWIVTVPLLAATAAFALWFYRPAQSEIADMQAELAVKQASLDEAASLPLPTADLPPHLRPDPLRLARAIASEIGVDLRLE